MTGLRGPRATGPEPTRPALLIVGAGVVAAGMADTVVGIAERWQVGVLNSFLAKGLFPFDHPAHLGTVGLQRDDIALAGVHDAMAAGGTVVVSGAEELAAMLPTGVVAVSPPELIDLRWPEAQSWPRRPLLYEHLAAVCGPAYSDDTTPLSPIRAAGDLSGWLPDDTVVVAGAGLAGFWLGRTFPTRTPGSVVLPPDADPTFVPTAVDALLSARYRVVVVADPATGDVADAVAGRQGVVVERWLPDGPVLDPADRLGALQAAYAAGGGDVAVGVRIGDLGAVGDVAGPVVAWGGLGPDGTSG